MGYEPNYYTPMYGDTNPYRNMTPQMMQPRRQMPQIMGDQLIKVTGEAGVVALANTMAPNSRAAAFDANDDILYIITTDGAAYPSWQTFRFSLLEKEQQPLTAYATQDDLNALKTEMKEAFELVKQLIQGGESRPQAVPPKGTAGPEL